MVWLQRYIFSRYKKVRAYRTKHLYAQMLHTTYRFSYLYSSIYLGLC